MCSLRVLLAEDDSDHQELLLLALGGADEPPQVTVASTPSQFLEALADGTFDAVVLDYNLCDRKADCLIREAGALLAGTPVIVVSSNQAQHAAIASFREGVADFLPKSEAIVASTLLRRIETAVEVERRRRAERRGAVRRRKELLKLAETDPLTGLANRRAADRWFAGQRWRKDRRRLCACAMIDIDNFKSINDTLGHPTGDRVLRSVAEAVSSALRPGDVAVRWGGEEFLVISPAPENGSDAWRWAEALRRTVRERCAAAAGVAIPVTVSIGLATLPTAELTIDAVTLADHALYLAKERGRDRVCTWEMVKFERLAMTIGADAGDAAECRLGAFLRQSARDLGPVQIEHLVAHSRAVAGLATRIGQGMNLSPRCLEQIRVSALMHDLGKCVIPESLLGKPGSLDEDEWAMMHQHADEGASLAEALGFDGDIVEGIRDHHRRYDARPEHWPATTAELTTSIVAVADALVTMTSERPYRSAMSTTMALAELRRHSGTQFHPVAVQAAGEVWREARPREAAPLRKAG